MERSPTNTATPPSFFDEEPAADRTGFWMTSLPAKHRLSNVIHAEGDLLTQENGFLSTNFYMLFQDRLVAHNNSRDRRQKGVVTLRSVRVDIIKDKKNEKSGFRLTGCKFTAELFVLEETKFDAWHKALRKTCVFRDFNVNYTITKAIGKGTFANVYQATRTAGDTKEYAVKSFDKRKIAPDERTKLGLLNEINMMRIIEHPNIIKLYEVYETDNHINLVLELLRGGELFDRVISKGFYTEQDASSLMRKVLSGLEYMHMKGIMHRDLKPENLIIASLDNDCDVKIADFGLATYTDTDEQIFKRCGTPGYVAPEILSDQPYDQRVDMFSIGSILFILLTGASPFYGDSYNEILIKNKRCEVSYDFSEYEQKPSKNAVELLKGLLEKDPKKRFTTREALNHPWITGKTEEAPLSNAQKHMRKFLQEKNLKLDATNRREVMKAENMMSNSPLINGRTDAIEEEKGRTYLDSPSLRPAPKKDPDMRKIAIMKNANKFDEDLKSPKSNPGSPKLEKKSSNEDDKSPQKRSSFSKHGSMESEKLTTPAGPSSFGKGTPKK